MARVWVATDKDGTVMLYSVKPKRNRIAWKGFRIETWINERAEKFILDSLATPPSWEDEPEEYEMLLSPIKQK